MSESRIIQPGQIHLPPSFQPKEVDLAGGFRKGEIIPLKGLFLRVVGILADEHGMFQISLMPVGPTKGAIKKAAGKKGPKYVLPSLRANGRPVPRVSDRLRSRAAATKEATA